MRRLVLQVLSVVVISAALIVTYGWMTVREQELDLVLYELEGLVTVTGIDEQADKAKVGRRLVASDRITTGDDSHAVLSIGADTRIRVGASSKMEVKAVDEEGVQLELEDGMLEATVRPGSGSLRLSSAGREALLTDADIAMGVGVDGTLQLESTRGVVMIGGVSGVSTLTEGSRMTVPPEGHAGLEAIPEDLLLSVEWPAQARTREERVVVVGHTAPGATVVLSGGIEGVVVFADAEGRFEAPIVLREGDNPVQISATDQLGNEAVVDGRLERDTKGPGYSGSVEYRP